MSRKPAQRRERGATLLIAVAILTLLSVFAIAFVRIVRFERKASANYTDGVRARMLARAGIERAVAELQRLAGNRHYSWPAEDNWAYSADSGADTPADLATAGARLDLHSTLNPSFAMTDPEGRELYGSPLVYSGVLGESYEDAVDVYKLKILDTARMVNLNHPDPVAAKRMLKNLLRSIGPLGLSAADALTVANRTVDARQANGFDGKAEIRATLVDDPVGPNITPEQWRVYVRDRVTVYGWVDESVVRPWALNCGSTDVAPYAEPAEDAERQLRPLPRAPVNLNTASVEVLTAVLAELKAVAPRYGVFEIPYSAANQLAQAIVTRRTGTGPFRTWVEFEAFLDSAACDAAFGSASYTPAPAQSPIAAPTNATSAVITQYTGDSGGQQIWWQSERPTNGNSPTRRALDTRNQGCRDLVKAMLNPNTMVSKLGNGPNHGGGHDGTASRNPVPRLVDKSDIVSLTTEGCFDAMGIFEITSIGMILKEDEKAGAADMKLLAAQTEAKVLQVYDVLRLTTQEEFERHRAFMVPGNFFTAQDKAWTYERLGTNREDYGPTTPAAADPVTPREDGDGFEGWPGVLTMPNYSLDRRDRDNNYEMEAQYVPAAWDGSLTLTNLIAYAMADPDFIWGFARGRLEAFKARAWWEPKDQWQRDRPGYTGGEPVDPLTPTHPFPTDSGAELDQLTSPMAGTGSQKTPRTSGRLSNEGLVVDDQPTAAATDAYGMFLEGSSLWNTGVAIHGRRDGDDGASPGFIAFDSNNLDLNRGTSIRFWVQPLVDGFLREEEVLMSFVGSNGGGSGLTPVDDGAFRREVGFKVVKRVQGSQIFVELYAVGQSPSDMNVGGTNVQNARGGFWHLGSPVVSVNVTPFSNGTTPTDQNPQWLPGSWHWIVVNVGPNVALEAGSATNQFTASLQVDQAKTFPTNKLRFRGSDGNAYGELHGYDSIWWPSDLWTRDVFTESASNLAHFWRDVRLLGDWYHCDHAPGTDTTVSLNEEVFLDAVRPYDGSDVLDQTDPTADDGVFPAADGYGEGPGWPSDPFASAGPTAYDKTLTLRWEAYPNDGSGNSPPGDQDMSPNPPGGGGGSGTDVGGWYYTFDDSAEMADGVPGGQEWQIHLVASWKEATPSGTLCGCCHPDSSLQATHGGVSGSPADPKPGRRWTAGNGSTVDVSCNHDWMATQVNGIGPVVGSMGYCYMLHKGPGVMNINGNGAPILYTLADNCDNCHGCERCDIDGPIFFGGEPDSGVGMPHDIGMGQNLVEDGDPATPVELNPVSPETMAYAVFDNVIVMNSKERRTDFDDGDSSTPAPRSIEDRYFDSTMAFATNWSAPSYGAIYHRGLLELIGKRGRLGTITWTSYPTNAVTLNVGGSVSTIPGLNWEVGLWALPDFATGSPGGGPIWDINNDELLGSVAPYSPKQDTIVTDDGLVEGFYTMDDDEDRQMPDSADGAWAGNPVGGRAHMGDANPGIWFEPDEHYVGTTVGSEYMTAVTEPSLLVLGLRLQNIPTQSQLYGAENPGGGASAPPADPDDLDTSGSGTRGAPGSGAVIPVPLTETPVFEDVTITLILDHPKVIYAEEGVEE